MNYFEQMGIVGYPLIACSTINLAIIAQKLIYLLSNHALSSKLVHQLLKTPTTSLSAELEKSLQKNQFGRVILELYKMKSLDNDERENLLSLELLTIQNHLSRYLQLLKLLASISPLLGLLGTILGMMEAFDAIAQAGGPITPALIASGISAAMMTTAAGLLIAIPSLLAYSLFQMRISSLVQNLTQQLNLVNQHIKHLV